MPQRDDIALLLDGPKIYEFTLERVTAMLKDILEETDRTIDQVDHFVFHQANRYIIHNLARLMKIPMEKVPLSLGSYGNTSSASIPLTITTCLNEYSARSARFVLLGFGVGLAWSAVALEWDNGIICPLVTLEC